MNIKYISFLTLLCCLCLAACQKSELLTPEVDQEYTTIISAENEKLLNDFTNEQFGGGRGVGNVEVLEGMLKFSDQRALVSYYESIRNFSKSWDQTVNSQVNETSLGDPAETSVNERLGFESLGELYSQLDYENPEFRAELEHYYGSPMFQTLFSSKLEMAIGDQIFKLLPMNRLAIIENLSMVGLEDVRTNELFATHESVQYYNRDTDNYYRIGPGGPDDPSGGGCSSRLSVMHQTFYGDDANKLKVVASVLNSNCLQSTSGANNAIKYTIDWGDGTKSHSRNITHTYAVPNFAIGECYTFTVTVTAEYIRDCGNCKKGKKHTKTFEVTLCPLDDPCTEEEGYNYKSSTFKTFQYGFDYKLVGELGVDNTWFPFFDWQKNIWARSTFYKKDGNKWKKVPPHQLLGVKLHGQVHSDSDCLFPIDIDLENEAPQKEVSVEDGNQQSDIFTHKTGSDILLADFWAVMTSNYTEELLDVPLWD